ncbi:hypothetical protein T8K17_11995 [Thalassobaculum sp. OXR-137]|uniref:hypothetical protein n=1 Tax=Thalassobaculum sp. OXR-137 TaxID=3100173 RepID=UPI002AC9A87A|nr:hypothetical protein [Thalassobaculum sp. OXR-137]WPZ36853.1 hypothetical protein T8K17_11995 [Thalassobaculum sp. OXR-137]
MSNDTSASSRVGLKPVDWMVAAVAAIACFVLMLKLGSFHVTPPRSLDGGWQAALQVAWLHDLQFGRDIVFPHGPYGAFYAQLYRPDLVGLWYLVNLSLTGALAVALVWSLRIIAGPGSGWQVLGSLLAVVAAAALAPGPDGVWMLPSFLLLSLALDDRNAPLPLIILLVLVLALATLVKFSFLVMGVTAVVAWSVAAAYRRDALALVALPLYAAAVVLLWLAAGQELSGMLDWMRASFEVGRGYGAAMSLTSNPFDLAVFGTLVILLLLGVWSGSQDNAARFVRAVVVLGWLGLFLLVAKAGFVRHDGHATFPFEMVVVTAVILVAQGLSPRRKMGGNLAFQILLLVAAAGWLEVAHTRLTPSGYRIEEQIADRVRHAPALLLEIANDLLSDEGKAAEYRVAADESRALLGGPHPRIASAASIDVFPFLSAPPILAGLPYHPRPVVQSYQAYLPSLAERDVEQVRRDGAEVYVLHLRSIDTRPAMADGGYLWPEFLSLYDPVDQVPLGLLIERRQEQLTLDSRTVIDAKAVYNTWIDLPETAAGAILQVHGDIRPTPLGRLFALGFKPPRITITLRDAQGQEKTRRLVPGQFGSGFPVSPVLGSAEDIRALFDGEAAGAPVTAFRINAAWLQQAFWGEGFALTVTEIRRPGQG